MAVIIAALGTSAGAEDAPPAGCTQGFPLAAVGAPKSPFGFDATMAAIWCGAPGVGGGRDQLAYEQAYRGGLSLHNNGEIWDAGAGFVGLKHFARGWAFCNPDTNYTRLLNAAIFLDWVQTNTFDPHPGVEFPANSPWMKFVGVNSPDGYEVKCAGIGSTVNAVEHDGFLAWGQATTLYGRFFWQETVAQRAATLVHEATHHYGAKHTDPGTCPATQTGPFPSCDAQYGAIFTKDGKGGGAQTNHILFLAQAVNAYKRSSVGAPLVMSSLNGSKRTCFFEPLLPDADRLAAFQTMRSKLSNVPGQGVFDTPPDPSLWPASAQGVDSSGLPLAPSKFNLVAGSFTYLVDIQNKATWDCSDICNANDFWVSAFDPSSGSKACGHVHDNYTYGVGILDQQSKAYNQMKVAQLDQQNEDANISNAHACNIANHKRAFSGSASEAAAAAAVSVPFTPCLTAAELDPPHSGGAGGYNQYNKPCPGGGLQCKGRHLE